MGRTRATIGDIPVLTALQTSLTDTAQNAAINYANQYYEEYQTQIWAVGVTLTAWIIWVSYASWKVTK